MHAIQTSGNCIRNVTADHFAGVAADEIADPRPYAEILRQWSSLHPEFSFLPRKFKIAVNGAPHDRAVIQAHDIGLQVVRDEAGELGFAVYVGGGLGRTPLIGHKVRDFLPERDLLAYVEAILRVYNLEGRRDNKYKARIKILVHEKGLETIREEVESGVRRARPQAPRPAAEEVARIRAFFAPPSSSARSRSATASSGARARTRASRASSPPTSPPTETPGYVVVTVSLKPIGGMPGDATRRPDGRRRRPRRGLFARRDPRLARAEPDPAACRARRSAGGLRPPRLGRPRDRQRRPRSATSSPAPASTIARSPPRARSRSPSASPQHFGDGARGEDIGPLKIKISGCINACGHHHVGHIGILGLERAGEETYQITLGGSGDENAAIGQIVGPGFSSEKVVEAVETIVETYMGLRRDERRDVPRSVPARRHRAVQGGALRAKRRIGHLMSAHDVKLFGDQIAASRLEDRFARVKASSLLRLAIEDLYPGRIALVSSFGADAAVLLHMVSRIDKATPVIFVDTGQHFPETLAYRDRLCETLGLTNVDQRDAATPRRWRRRTRRNSCSRAIPTAAARSARSGRSPRRSRAMTPGSPAARASRARPARRCRCSRPRASGSRSIRSSAGARRTCSTISPRPACRRHPLVAKGFPSIGCLPCTSAVRPGEDERAGRWRGRGKTECGIHTSALDAGADI